MFYRKKYHLPNYWLYYRFLWFGQNNQLFIKRHPRNTCFKANIPGMEI